MDRPDLQSETVPSVECWIVDLCVVDQHDGRHGSRSSDSRFTLRVDSDRRSVVYDLGCDTRQSRIARWQVVLDQRCGVGDLYRRTGVDCDDERACINIETLDMSVSGGFSRSLTTC